MLNRVAIIINYQRSLPALEVFGVTPFISSLHHSHKDGEDCNIAYTMAG